MQIVVSMSSIKMQLKKQLTTIYTVVVRDLGVFFESEQNMKSNPSRIVRMYALASTICVVCALCAASPGRR